MSRPRRPLPSTARCRAIGHQFAGHVFARTVRGRALWVAELECPVCSTRRYDYLTPRRCELVSRRYEHPGSYDTSLDRGDAKRIFFVEMLKGT